MTNPNPHAFTEYDDDINNSGVEDVTNPTEIPSRNTSQLYPSGPEAASPFDTYAAQFYIERLAKLSEMAPLWPAGALALLIGQTRQIIGPNPNRKRIVIWAEPLNAGNIYVSPSGATVVGAGSNALPLPPLVGVQGGLTFTHTGAIFGFAVTAGIAMVYFFEESLAQ